MKQLLVLGLLTCCTYYNSQAQCSAQFMFSANRGDVRFAAIDSIRHMSHTWVYGDGLSETGSLPAAYHRYNPGTYEVKHTVFDSVSNCKDSAIQSIELQYEPECYSYFTVEKFRSPNHLRFNPSYSSYGTEVVKVIWRIDGEVIAVDKGPLEYRFNQPGIHIISLSVETSSGCTSYYTDTIHAYKKCNMNTSFTYQSAPENARVIKLEVAPYNQDQSYWFNVGEDQRFVYTYEGKGHVLFEDEGAFPVSLIITDSITNCYDSVTKVIQVKGNAYDSCTASFKATSTNNKQYSLQPISNQPISKQVWIIYNHLWIDSIISSSSDPVIYNFSDTGNYIVSLQVYTSTGCTKVYSDSLKVTVSASLRSSATTSYPNPTTNFTTISVDAIKNTTAVIFIYNSNGEKVSTQKKHLLSGKNDIQLITSNLNRGNYFISIQYDGILIKSRFQKM